MYEALKGRLAALKDNRLFEFAVISVIIISTLEIGAKTYELPNLVNTLLVGLDWFITVFFVVEISIRFIADSDKKRFFKNGWNVFDTLVVVVSLIPVNDSELALLARLVRIFRDVYYLLYLCRVRQLFI